MVNYSISIFRNDEKSAEVLKVFFNEAENPIFCGIYGGGGHCDNKPKNALKLKVWGNKSEDKAEDACVQAKVIMQDGEPVALFNIGYTGSSPTILDKTVSPFGKVTELAGLIVRDAAQAEMQEISAFARGIMESCKIEEGYTKGFVTFVPSHPYQENFLEQAGWTKLTAENIDAQLGVDSMYPERFRFEDGQFQECSSLEEAAVVQHENWHDSNPCVNWIEKTAMIGAVGAHEVLDTEL